MKGFKTVLLLIFSFQVAEAQVQISQIKFFGNTAITALDAQRIGGVRRYDHYTPELCDTLKKRILRAYERSGYNNVSIDCRLLEETLAVKIEEGQPNRVKSVSVVQFGPNADKIGSIVRTITSDLVGQIVYPQALRRWRKQLLFAIRNEGYLFVSLGMSVDEEGRLSIPINPRGRVQFDIKGNESINDSEILSLLELSERLTPITPRALESLTDQLRGTYSDIGYPFSEVEVVEEGTQDETARYLILINEGERKFITKVDVVSDVPLKFDIYDVIKTRSRRLGPLAITEPGIFSKSTVASDLIAIEEKLRARGHIDAKADYSSVVTKDGIQVTFEIVPGEQFRIINTSSQIECPVEIEDKMLVSKSLAAVKGRLATSERIVPVKERIKDNLNQLGFTNPTVDLTFLKKDLTLNAYVRCGVREELSDVEIEGTVHTDRDYLNSVVNIKPGDFVYKVDEAVERLRATGIFSLVESRLEDSNASSINGNCKVKRAKITLRERDTGVLDTSVSLNTEDGLRLGGELSQRNFRSKGETLALTADLFLNNGPNLFDAGRAKALWRIPRIFGTEDSEFLSEGYFQYDIQTVNQFSFSRIGVDSQIRSHLDKFLLSGGISVFQDNIFDVLKDVILSDRDDAATLYSFVTTKLEFDNRDSSLAPTKGFYAAIAGKLANSAIGSEIDLFSLSAESKYYLKVSRELTWLNGIRGIKLNPYSDEGVVPISQRLFLGGANSLRGFDRNRLSPLGVANGRAGGDQEFIYNSELQWNLSESLQLATFVDVGQVEILNGGEQLKSRSTDVRAAPGFGIRYRTPVGPLGVDLGFPVNPREGESSPRIYFGFNGIF